MSASNGRNRDRYDPGPLVAPGIGCLFRPWTIVAVIHSTGWMYAAKLAVVDLVVLSSSDANHALAYSPLHPFAWFVLESIVAIVGLAPDTAAGPASPAAGLVVDAVDTVAVAATNAPCTLVSAHTVCTGRCVVADNQWARCAAVAAPDAPDALVSAHICRGRFLVSVAQWAKRALWGPICGSDRHTIAPSGCEAGLLSLCPHRWMCLLPFSTAHFASLFWLSHFARVGCSFPLASPSPHSSLLVSQRQHAGTYCRDHSRKSAAPGRLALPCRASRWGPRGPPEKNSVHVVASSLLLVLVTTLADAIFGGGLPPAETLALPSTPPARVEKLAARCGSSGASNVVDGVAFVGLGIRRRVRGRASVPFLLPDYCITLGPRLPGVNPGYRGIFSSPVGPNGWWWILTSIGPFVSKAFWCSASSPSCAPALGDSYVLDRCPRCKSSCGKA